MDRQGKALMKARETIVDQDQPDEHMEDREAEKLADLEALADALAAFRQLRRPLDQWERVHLARGLAAVLSGCYGIGASEAALALMPVEERSPSCRATIKVRIALPRQKCSRVQVDCLT